MSGLSVYARFRVCHNPKLFIIITCAYMQEESAAVVTDSLIKATAQEVSASRHKYQAKSAAAEQLRRHGVGSIESKTLEADKTQQV